MCAQVEVCAGESVRVAAHTWGGSEAAGRSRGAVVATLDSEVIGTVERASHAAVEIGSGGVWLTGSGSGSTEVVAAAARVLNAA